MLQSADRGEQLTAVANRGDAKRDQVLGREVSQDLGIDVVLAERLLVLTQPQTTQPSCNVHGPLPASSARNAEFFSLPQNPLPYAVTPRP